MREHDNWQTDRPLASEWEPPAEALTGLSGAIETVQNYVCARVSTAIGAVQIQSSGGLCRAIEAVHRYVCVKMNDARITAQLQSALDLLCPATGLWVNVDTKGGIVHLRGTVASVEQRAEAERVIRQVTLANVRQIVNELQVNPALPPILFP